MANYKVKVSYLGFLFYGWAKQKNKSLTIQEVIELRLKLILNEEINIFCSGRTDRMVNATEQVFSFKIRNKLKIPLDKLVLILNKDLNELNINIINIEEVDEEFHARFNAKSKIYRYYINTNKEFDLFHSNFQYQYNNILDINKLKEASIIFTGEHDFLSFSTSDLKNTVRIINFINILNENNLIIIEISGNGFLKNMVRMIVATLIRFAEGKVSINTIMDLLNNPKKGSSIYIAPPNGLTLFKVNY